ncbi:hypothetical protein [Knoellia sp. Soil729]|uniref:hypothetical protein n=1 Tax=Knoellia sp. Soil729 TaxID=1736394 RepID=UPI0006FAA23C|nr:hypothetical protein [Knoellia sp. Soil729]KRE43596.1 hypothetical protein ASG74_01765 [Knoellia sp. Soil729]
MTAITLQDPKDLLVPASGGDAYGAMIESAKGNCGIILQAIDWAAQKLLHFSPIEALMSPIAGDFNGVDRLRSNWHNVGLALTAAGNNYDTIAGAVGDAWQAPAAERAQSRMAQHAAAHRRQGTACGLMSRQLGNMLKATEQVVNAACGLLGLVEEWVLTMSLAKLAKEIFTGGAGVRRAIRLINQAIDLIKELTRLLPALSAAAAAVATALSALNVILSFAASADSSSAGNHVDETAEAGFR